MILFDIFEYFKCSQRPKSKILTALWTMYGATFYGRHTTQQTAAVITNKNIKLRSFKSSENIQKKDDRPDRSVSNNQFSLVTLNDMGY